MTENLPEVRHTNPMSIPTGPPKGDEWVAMKQQASMIAKSGMAPENLQDDPVKILTIALKGREIGVPPMQALSHINIVKGKPTISAELMAALAQRAGHKIRVLESTGTKCTVQGVRLDDPDAPQQVTFTLQEAKEAGITNNPTWKKYPAAMLRARAISALCRFAFADVLMGASYTPEELGGTEPEARHEQRRMAEREEEITVTDEEVEEAQVVDHEDDDDEEDGPGQVRIAEVHDLSTEIWGDPNAYHVEVKNLGGALAEELTGAQCDALIRGLNRVAERKRKANQEARVRGGGDSPEEERSTGTHPDEVEGVTKGGANGKKEEDLPATKKQKNYLEALINDAVAPSEDTGTPPLQMFEEMIEKPLEEITRGEASEWIGRLSGRVA